MSGWDKIEAVSALEAHGLLRVPIRVVRRPHQVSTRALRDSFTELRLLVLRTAAVSEERNLPRLVGATPAAAAKWIGDLAPGLSVLVQPYEQVLFSVELAVYESVVVAEIVPGIWELDSLLTPAVLVVKDDGLELTVPDTRLQTARFHDPQHGIRQRPACVDDWQIATLVAWIREHRRHLTALLEDLGHPFGLKLHHSSRYGLSAQNIRSSVPEPGTWQQDTPALPNNTSPLSSTSAPLPEGLVGWPPSVGPEPPNPPNTAPSPSRRPRRPQTTSPTTRPVPPAPQRNCSAHIRHCSTLADGVLHCVVPPGQDYTHHYAEFLGAACAMTDLPAEITVEHPVPGQGLAFVDHWLPRNLPAHDLAILGYVEPLLTRAPASSTDWNHRPGFGWRTARIGRSTALLLGCEFSFWGDLAGDLVTALITRGHTSGVLYVGKLGGLQSDMEPNTVVVTGTTTQVKGHSVSWKSALDLDPTLPGLRTGVRHITVPSVLDETRIWLEQHRAHFDVVDPEIGHMALAATTANVPFDYLHIVTDNLNGTHDHGLYAERSTPVATRRRRCLHHIETILHRSLA
ncbi:hypothetical protein BDW27_102482 [Nocardiopsis sp. L17-MgMaSL7]|nr:hypothetical protein BDW27_102482 [Nocardiopsis sp. L17-MgMaSL7]